MESSDVLALFDVDLIGGKLFWKAVSKYHGSLNGKQAGSPRPTHNGKSYWVIGIGGKAYRRGRLIFLVMHGRWPAPCLDHIDGNSLNDASSNLRECTVTENAWNHKKRARRISLPMGVRVVASSGRFAARISYHGRQIHLGAFDTAIEAQQVYLQKRKELYGQFA